MKAWWKSKTVWINVVGLLLLIGQSAADNHWIATAIIAAILGALNLILRALTAQPVTIPMISQVLQGIGLAAKPKKPG